MNTERSHNASHDELAQNTPEGYDFRLLSITLVNYILSEEKYQGKLTVIRETDSDELLVYLADDVSKDFPKMTQVTEATSAQ
jgi:hypothetical protein